MTFNEENKKLYIDFLERYFFNFWKGEQKSSYGRPLELNLSPYCSLKCKYCYVNKFREKLYPINVKNDNLLKNTEILLEWLIKNGYNVGEIEIFSGDSFTAAQIDKLYALIFDYAKMFKVSVVVPINPVFAADEEKVNVYVKWRENFSSEGLSLHFSLSMDGKYADIARPFANPNFSYDDKFYEKVSSIAKTFDFGFHPMIAPENIEVWKKNLEWYLDFIQKAFQVPRKTALQKLYLLEVRNPNWTKLRLLQLASFVFFLTKTTFSIYNNDPRAYVEEFIREDKGANFYSGIMSTVGRGFTCSIQEFLTVRVADLTITPCHRVAWPGYESAQFKVQNNKVIAIEPKNPWVHIAILTGRNDAAPFCSHCPINSLCTGVCLGTNLEYNKQPFIPVPNVCQMEFAKHKAIAKSFKILGIWDEYERFMKKKKYYFDSFRKLNQMKYLLEEQQ